MPASARKSSIGSRRATQKYVPYRRDDLQHGKKTGIAVQYVDHKSDEFEPFDRVMSQADQRTPPRVQNQRKKRTPKPKTPIREEVYDEDGEMSMVLEDSTPNSPSEYFAHARKSLTSSIQRVGSSSRPVARSSDVDFDKLPSPRASPAASLANGRKSLPFGRSPGPSHLSQSTMPPEDIDVDDGGMDYDGPDYGGFGSDDDDADNASGMSVQQSQTHRKSTASSRRTSFVQMDQDEEEEEQVEDMATEGPVSAKAKGKQRAVRNFPPPQDFDGITPDAEDGLEPMDADGADDQHQDEDAEQSPEREEPPPKKKPRGRSKKENILRDVTPDENTDGLRRGKRKRYAPLDWWRCEKVVYGRRDSGTSLVPNIKYIRRLPKEEPQPLGAKHKRRIKRGKSKTVEAEQDPNLVYNPEEGWDDDTQATGVILNYEDDQEIEKRVAFTAKMVVTKPAANHEFFFQKIFGDGDFIAAGQLMIPPGKQKPTKGTKDNTFMFYVIEGAVNFKVHRTNYVLSTGSMFMVPRGNMYFIQNISDRDARLFFAQARKITSEEEEGRRSLSHHPASQRRESGSHLETGRSSSAMQEATPAGPSRGRSAK